MTSKLTGRVVELKLRTAPDDLERWLKAPVDIRPDWVLMSEILDRLLSPAEADRLNKDDEVWRRIELLCAADEESDEWDAIRGDLVEYVEQI